MRLLRSIEVGAKQLSWTASRPIAGLLQPAALGFYDQLQAGGYEPDALVNVLPTHKVIYIAVPKAASTRIKATLAQIIGRHSRTLRPSRWKFRGPYGPRSMTVTSFFRLATGAQTFCFSFVRNPYARAVSCWADKFQGKPLVAGDGYVDLYLARRNEVDARLPEGPDRTLSFADFVVFAAAMARRRCDIHIQAQIDLVSMPGINLDFVGKVESFAKDFAQVLDRLDAPCTVRHDAVAPLNDSEHGPWRNYYTSELADRIYDAYECDFDRFGYSRATAGCCSAFKAQTAQL